jgi:hypothetical protein
MAAQFSQPSSLVTYHMIYAASVNYSNSTFFDLCDQFGAPNHTLRGTLHLGPNPFGLKSIWQGI